MKRIRLHYEPIDAAWFEQDLKVYYDDAMDSLYIHTDQWNYDSSGSFADVDGEFYLKINRTLSKVVGLMIEAWTDVFIGNHPNIAVYNNAQRVDSRFSAKEESQVFLKLLCEIVLRTIEGEKDSG